MKVLDIIFNWNSFSPKPPHICIIKTTGVRHVNPTVAWTIRKYGFTKGEAIKKAVNRYISAVKHRVTHDNNIRRRISG